MNRRTFLHAGITGAAVSMLMPAASASPAGFPAWRSYRFQSFRQGQYPASLTKVTPDDGFYLHTFYDTCPWSPSGRYLAVTKFPYQGKKPAWGDTAEVCVIDLQQERIRQVYTTKAWSFQLGANIQWGHSGDRYLYTNDIIHGEPVCICIDLQEETVRHFAGAKYDISPDDRYVISPNLLNMNIHQYGYAVPDGPTGKPVPFTTADMTREGLWRTDLKTDTKQLLVSLQQFFQASSDAGRYANSIGYLFHSQYNRQNTRILQVFRAQVDNQGRNASLFSMHTDGSGLQECLSEVHWNQLARLGGSGNHPNWHPDGEHIIMNCVPTWLGFKDMLFCTFRYDGAGFRPLSEKHLGSGHPTVESSGRYLLADAYPKQSYAGSANGEVIVRLLDLQQDTEITLCHIPNDVGGGVKQATPEDRITGGSQHKLDPHPVWNRNEKQVCMNGAPEGKRQVFIADLKNLI